MATPHIAAPDDAFAPTVLLPGDPKRATHIAEQFLTGAELITDIRAMVGYTGQFDGQTVSVMATGMGMPSAAIYVTELITHYEVRRLIRVGTAGIYVPDLALRQLVAVDEARTTSSLPEHIGANAPFRADPELLKRAHAVAEAHGQQLLTGPILTTDVFYEPAGLHAERAAQGLLGVEMETAAIYALAGLHGVEALSLLTMTDHLATGERLTAAERQLTVDEMLELGLRIAAAS